MFALDNWKYDCSNDLRYKPYYNIEQRKQDNKIKYNIWNKEIIDIIRNIYNNQPITELEEEARNNTGIALN